MTYIAPKLSEYLFPERRQRLLALAILAYSDDMAAGTTHPVTLECGLSDEQLARLTGLSLRSVRQGLAALERAELIGMSDPLAIEEGSGPRRIWPNFEREFGA